MMQENKVKDDLINLISILDSAVNSKRRRSLAPVLILLEHHISQYHNEDNTYKLKINEKGHYLEESTYSLFSKKLQTIKNGFDSNMPAAHLIFSLRNLISTLAQSRPYATDEDIITTNTSTTSEKDPKEVFKEYLIKQDGRLTKTKEFIIDEIFKLDDHFEVDDFLNNTKSNDIKIARATVYRTIKQLLEAGLLQKISTKSGKVYYEKSSPQNEHAHLICNTCGKLLEIKEGKIRDLLDKYCKKMNFKLQYQSIHVYGECLNKDECNK
tara:strand:- start:322 stop:1125 length:804 start_codon:yes stop_codon:yes gene_type:complete